MKIVACVAVLLVVGCSEIAETDFDVVPRAPTVDYAQVRVLHVSADTPSQDIYLRDTSQPLMSEVSYGLAQGFYEILARDYTVDFRPAGAVINGEPTYSQDITVASEERVTFVLVDGPFLLRVRDDLGRVDVGAMQVVNTSEAPVSVDLGDDGSTEVADLQALAVARATTADVGETTLAVIADNGRQTYVLPSRPLEGDVLLVVTAERVLLLTYSFTVTTLTPP